MVVEVERKFKIGKDVSGREVTLRHYQHYQGKMAWEFLSQAHHQLDQSDKFDGLSDENIENILEVLGLVKGKT